MFSLFKNARKEFTRHIGRALSHFIHVFLVMGSLLSVLNMTDWYLEEKYFYQIFFALCMCFVRNTTYMQVCVVA